MENKILAVDYGFCLHPLLTGRRYLEHK